MNPAIYAIAIFIVVYFFIITEKINKAVIAMFGAFLLIILGIVSQEAAFTHYIDFNTIFFLIGMMIIVGIIKRTGFFEYLAVKSVKLSKGNPLKIMIMISAITAFFSAFLDNVTTVLLIVPVMLYITKELHINPIPISMAVIFASNIGGTATLIGDPPNILIGSQTHLTFMDFINNLTLISIFILIITLMLFSFLYRKKLKHDVANESKASALNDTNLIKDKKLLTKSMAVLFFAILGFVFHGQLQLESATISLFAASILMMISKTNIHKAFREVEWETIFFFIGLFVLVGGLEATGVIQGIAEMLMQVTQGKPMVTAVAILWLAAIVSAFLDNIPFTATMIPIIKITGELSGMDTFPLWWALALGACLGGNGTAIGASANVVAIGMLNEAGVHLPFKKYFKTAFPLMLVSIVIATIYIVLRYYNI